MSKPSLLIVIPDLGSGGAQLMNLRLADGLQRRGWQVKVVVLFNRWCTIESKLYKNLDLLILGGAKFYDKIQISFKLAKLAKEVDIVLGGVEWAATTYSFAGARLANKPFVAWTHSNYGLQTLLGRVDRNVNRFIYQRIKWLVFPSRGAYDSFLNVLGDRVQGALWQVIENFQTLYTDLPSALPPDQRIFSKPVIMGVGRLAREKAFDRLIRAHATLRRHGLDHHLVILGDGPLRQELEREIQHLGVVDSVFLPGHVDNVMDWLGHATVFALCSRYEGFGLVLLEALGCGVPSVAMDCPAGPREILQDGEAGLLVPDGDEEAFQEAIARLLISPELRKHYADRGRERAKYYSPERVIPKWEALLERVMASS